MARILDDFELTMREALDDDVLTVDEASRALVLVVKAEEELARKHAKLSR